jgi:hypothetical protein
MYAKLGPFNVNSVRIAEIFLVSGIILLAISVFLSSQILAFVGLGLTFWGVLFILVTPQKQVEGNLLGITIIPEYLTIDRIINDLKPKGKAYWIPPYPQDVNMPEHLRGLKEMVIFIPSDEVYQMVSIEEIAKGKFQIENPKGILLAPPGLGIIDKIEQKRDTNLTKIPFNNLSETLPQLLGELNLSKEVKMTINENDATLQITESMYRSLYGQKYNLKSVLLLGCPLVNAGICAIAKSSGKIVTMQKIETSPDGQITTANIKLIQL